MGNPGPRAGFPWTKTAPLPTPEDRLCFRRTDLKTSALQVVQGCLFGMVQGQAHQWMHVRLPALLAARRTLGAAPTRSLPALAPRRGVSEADAATVVTPREENPVPLTEALATAPASPLVPRTAPHGALSAPKTLLHRRSDRAARKKTTRSTMSCWSMPGSRSSCSVTPVEAASRSSAWPMPRPLLCLLGAGGCRIWASRR
jgi:hypothetical protein